MQTKNSWIQNLFLNPENDLWPFLLNYSRSASREAFLANSGVAGSVNVTTFKFPLKPHDRDKIYSTLRPYCHKAFRTPQTYF